MLTIEANFVLVNDLGKQGDLQISAGSHPVQYSTPVGGVDCLPSPRVRIVILMPPIETAAPKKY